MIVVVVDKKYRVLLGRKLREIIGVEKGGKLLAVPFKGGVILTSLKGKGFIGSLNDFKYDERLHEASKHLFGGG